MLASAGTAHQARVRGEEPEPARQQQDLAVEESDEGFEPGPETVKGGSTPPEANATSLTIPDDPTVLSYLLSGIVQAELPRRQRLLEAATTVERLEELITLLDREVLLLARRLRLFAPDPRIMDAPRRS